MYWDIEIKPEEEERIIKKFAEEIKRRGMESVAILFLEITKPMSFIGAQMGRFIISPFMLGEDIGIGGEKLLRILEKRDNYDKLICYLETEKEDEDEKKISEKTPGKKGWRRLIPFI